MINEHGEEQVRKWACECHGGLLEDKIKAGLRQLATDGQCRLQNAPKHLRPTVGERLEDIRGIFRDNEKWNDLEESQKKFLISEYALLQKDARLPGGMNAVLRNIEDHNETVERSSQSERFRQSVPDIENTRLNLGNMELGKVVDEFNKSEIERLRQEQKANDALEKEFDKENAQPAGPMIQH